MKRERKDDDDDSDNDDQQRRHPLEAEREVNIHERVRGRRREIRVGSDCEGKMWFIRRERTVYENSESVNGIGKMELLATLFCHLSMKGYHCQRDIH